MTGIFIAVVGRSGVGKDSILEGAKTRLDASKFYFPQRFITRPAEAGGENHIFLTPEDFRLRRKESGFALHWEAHGLCYGLGEDVTGKVEQGLHVIANISRTKISEASLKFNFLRIIEITASPESIADRLSNRDRETEIQQQSRRRRQLKADWSEGLPVTRVNNDGLLSVAIDKFVAVVNEDFVVTE